MSGASIVRGNVQVDTGKPGSRQELSSGAGPLQENHLASHGSEGFQECREGSDTESAGDAYGRAAGGLDCEALPERSEDLDGIALAASGEPGAARANDIEDEADPT
jgi:hypothetical protein